MLVEILTRTEEYILCPHCQRQRFSVGHLASEIAGPWYCHECGGSFVLHRSVTRIMEAELRTERKLRTLVTLRSEEPVTLIVEGARFVKESPNPEGEDEDEEDRYLYEEHTCPTNFIGTPVVQVRNEFGDTDPHGIFRYVRTEPWRNLEQDGAIDEQERKGD